jgi:two-component system response regulator AtoC
LRTFSDTAIAQLQSYAWPGNIRELRNVVERLLMTSTGENPISGDEVKQVLPKEPSGLQTGDLIHASLDDVERLHIQRVLDACGGNKTKAAKTLDIDYKTLLTKLKKYDLAG